MLSSEPIEGGLLAQINGDINLKNSAELRNAFMETVSDGVPVLIVDMGGVSFMDSSGVATLVEVLRVQRQAGNKLVLCNLQPRVQSVFTISKLDSLFTIVADVEAAKEA